MATGNMQKFSEVWTCGFFIQRLTDRVRHTDIETH